MGLVILVLAGEVIVPIFVGVMLKLLADAISVQLTGTPFRYIGWWLVWLCIAAWFAAFWMLYAPGVFLPSSSMELYIFMYGALIGFPTLCILSGYGLIKWVYTKFKKPVDLN